ncbi:Hypothetical predicted protein [Podarcis lilfordi]|uniref:Uncharacterized protein n=1 Tax=Podarcis lilfordi TaxID=74358 RepID=A0AA35LL56_9SAUR|nr:Hypothetical predicted protein [Podarcis lilfordi]
MGRDTVPRNCRASPRSRKQFPEMGQLTSVHSECGFLLLSSCTEDDGQIQATVSQALKSCSKPWLHALVSPVRSSGVATQRSEAFASFVVSDQPQFSVTSGP